MSYKAI